MERIVSVMNGSEMKLDRLFCYLDRLILALMSQCIWRGLGIIRLESTYLRHSHYLPMYGVNGWRRPPHFSSVMRTALNRGSRSLPWSKHVTSQS